MYGLLCGRIKIGTPDPWGNDSWPRMVMKEPVGRPFSTVSNPIGRSPCKNSKANCVIDGGFAGNEKEDEMVGSSSDEGIEASSGIVTRGVFEEMDVSWNGTLLERR